MHTVIFLHTGQYRDNDCLESFEESFEEESFED